MQIPSLRQVYARAKAIPREIIWRVAERFDESPAATTPFEVSQELRQHWEEHGWIVLRSAVPEEALERLLAEINDFRREGRGGQDEFGRGLRVGLLHAVRRQSLGLMPNCAANQRVSELSWLYPTSSATRVRLCPGCAR